VAERLLAVFVPVGAVGARQSAAEKDAEFHRGSWPMVACASLCFAAITEDAMPDDIITADLFEIIRTTRSMRRLKPDPVPDTLLRRILEAGVCAPSGGNMQRWRFLVVKDAAVKATVGALYKRAWDEQVGPRYRAGEPTPGATREQFLRMLGAAEYLAAHIHEAPVWIVPCLEGGTPTRTSGSSIYPAVQNMLLAARALDLGATLTTLYLAHEKEAETALGLPPGVHSYALLPIGYPMGRFGPVRRVALSDVVFEDRWGRPSRMAQ
jgi:nitroreductase